MLEDLLTYRCPPTSAAGLVSPVTVEEIISALNALPNDKVSGPDGFTKEFYVAAWSVIGGDFITAVQSFFIYGFLPTGINATILTLIPKTEEAQTMKDFRPIACCNLIYKVISKVLARRLKTILPEAIEANQTAFIKGRLMLENVLLASELVNGYHKESNSNRATVKFDISKAFDTIYFAFLSHLYKIHRSSFNVRVFVSFFLCFLSELNSFRSTEPAPAEDQLQEISLLDNNYCLFIGLKEC
ncbi:hypothetical protein Bca101_029634 [Brassica carinata]